MGARATGFADPDEYLGRQPVAAESTGQSRRLRFVAGQPAFGGTDQVGGGAGMDQQRLAWEEERQAMREQLERLQAERRVLREQATTAGVDIPSSKLVDFADQEMRELRRQVEQASRNVSSGKKKAGGARSSGEQEKIALEAEIEQLMERLLRLHRERSA